MPRKLYNQHFGELVAAADIFGVTELTRGEDDDFSFQLDLNDGGPPVKIGGLVLPSKSNVPHIFPIRSMLKPIVPRHWRLPK